MLRRNFLKSAVGFTGAVVTGCTKSPEKPVTHQALKPEQVFAKDETEYHVGIVVDLSGSFEKLMATDGEAWQFALMLFDQVFKDRVGGDRIVISTITGDKNVIRFDGTPLELRRRFQTPEEFAAFLKSKPIPGNSPICHTIANTVEYMMGSTTNRKAKFALFALSDMHDDGNDEKAELRMNFQLMKLAAAGGAIGVYYIGGEEVLRNWNQRLPQYGFRDGHWKTSIIGVRPPLPRFE